MDTSGKIIRRNESRIRLVCVLLVIWYYIRVVRPRLFRSLKRKRAEEDLDSNGEKWYEEDDGASSANYTKKTKSGTNEKLPSTDELFISSITQIFNKDRVIEDSTNLLRAKINDTLKPIGLSDRDRLTLGRKMSQNDKLLHYFFSLNDADRETCARMELDEIGSYRPTYG